VSSITQTSNLAAPSEHCLPQRIPIVADTYCTVIKWHDTLDPFRRIGTMQHSSLHTNMLCFKLMKET
jgi:hypothetical protein